MLYLLTRNPYLLISFVNEERGSLVGVRENHLKNRKIHVIGTEVLVFSKVSSKLVCKAPKFTTIIFS